MPNVFVRFIAFENMNKDNSFENYINRPKVLSQFFMVIIEKLKFFISFRLFFKNKKHNNK